MRGHDHDWGVGRRGAIIAGVSRFGKGFEKRRVL